MNLLFISPHLDDAVLSCGGLINIKSSLEQVYIKVVSIFAGLPLPEELSRTAKEFHQDCGLVDNAVEIRKNEDLKAANILGFKSVHFNLLECLYRQNKEGKHLYNSTNEIFTNIIRESTEFLSTIEYMIETHIDLNVFTEIYIPIALGNHIDHYIVRHVLEKIIKKRKIESKIVYYEDMPYAFNLDNPLTMDVNFFHYLCKLRTIDFNKKIEAIYAYESQVKMLWTDKENIINNYQNFSYLISNKKENYYERYWKKN